jgi:signal transduction histidine kinase
MDRLTRDLLEYSRLTRAEVTLHPLRVRDIMDEILAELGEDVERAQARVTVEVADQRVMGNRFLLKEALTNLVGNALKFTRPGVPAEVRMGAREEAGQVRLFVEDKGIGIAPAHQARLFRVFERLNPEGPHEGTGIGLAIARKVVERMNGSIGVESETGKGSRFWIELPRAEKP